MNNDDLIHWLALSFVKEIGPVTVKKLLSVFHTPEKIFRATLSELREVEAVGESRAKGIREFRSWHMVEKEIKSAHSRGIRIISYTDEDYPSCLRELEDSPVVLYLKGDLTAEDRYAVAIVGSRLMTDYGRTVTEGIASGLAVAGITVISGMARGIDTVAHKEALRSGGRSIAVLGCGLDRPYPPENRILSEEISRSGCVISEFPLGTPPNRENFPKRNRL
ncbi:MAG: DNA-processing protein DprA, partial [Nitrospirales bacterium]|nr:DNA-processing protein DprA [Nitrospirales bacterium]